ncbi:uncharacterized protein LOC142061467 isoform X2 [Phalacrocorax aristotelis]|uniref:uncharacterized protein LOC142061467 isoform X2 n=1 Tax=Phalacrocorax aristotelis TaxID=126867 RepID=UPI003F4BFB86
MLDLNECMKIWSLLRSGKFSCPTNKEPVRSPDGKTDLNKCLMCQRLLERDTNKGSGGEANRNANLSGEDDCEEFQDLFERGKLSCTRENDPVRDSSGKQHSNKCIMCAEKFKREKEQKLSKNRQGKDKDDCSEYRSHFEAHGRLSCTRENDPVRDSSGKQHINKCLMCAEKFKKEAQRGQSGGTAQRNKPLTSKGTSQKSCGGSGSQQGVNERRPISSNRGSNGVQTASKHQGSSVTKGQVKEELMLSIRGAAKSPGLPELSSSSSAVNRAHPCSGGGQRAVGTQWCLPRSAPRMPFWCLLPHCVLACFYNKDNSAASCHFSSLSLVRGTHGFPTPALHCVSLRQQASAEAPGCASCCKYLAKMLDPRRKSVVWGFVGRDWGSGSLTCCGGLAQSLHCPFSPFLSPVKLTLKDTYLPQRAVF